MIAQLQAAEALPRRQAARAVAVELARQAQLVARRVLRQHSTLRQIAMKAIQGAEGQCAGSLGQLNNNTYHQRRP